jgi:hypothetical protein
VGWSTLSDGCLDGDGPADAFGNTFKAISVEAKQRAGELPTGALLLQSFVAALNLDGSRAPFYAEKTRIAALTLSHAGKRLRIDGTESERWIVAELYEMLDEVAESYVDSWNRAPNLHELLHYVDTQLADPDPPDTTYVSDPEPWEVIATAKMILGKTKKTRDRSTPPAASAAPVAKGRVKHPKFGEGLVVAEEGERLTIQFENERRVLMRSFVTKVD